MGRRVRTDQQTNPLRVPVSSGPVTMENLITGQDGELSIIDIPGDEIDFTKVPGRLSRYGLIK